MGPIPIIFFRGYIGNFKPNYDLSLGVSVSLSLSPSPHTPATPHPPSLQPPPIVAAGPRSEPFLVASISLLHSPHAASANRRRRSRAYRAHPPIIADGLRSRPVPVGSQSSIPLTPHPRIAATGRQIAPTRRRRRRAYRVQRGSGRRRYARKEQGGTTGRPPYLGEEG